MDNLLVVFNPSARRGSAYKLAHKIEDALQAANLSYEIVITEQPGHAMELGRRAALAGRELVVAAGGDGTINEVVNGLAQAAGSEAINTKLGVLPMGSGNDFAGALGIPADLRQAAQLLRKGETRWVDLGCVNGRYFDNNCGLGFEAMIDIEAHKLTWLRGQLQYLVAVFRAMSSYPFPVVTLTSDQEIISNRSILMISIGNNRRIGGGFLITPHAVPDDGLLDVCLVDALPRLEILRLLPKAMTGKHEGEPAVHMSRGTHIVVESEDVFPVHADGEVLWTDARRVEISIEPSRLQVIV